MRLDHLQGGRNLELRLKFEQRPARGPEEPEEVGSCGATKSLGDVARNGDGRAAHLAGEAESLAVRHRGRFAIDLCGKLQRALPSGEIPKRLRHCVTPSLRFCVTFSSDERERASGRTRPPRRW